MDTPAHLTANLGPGRHIRPVPNPAARGTKRELGLWMRLLGMVAKSARL